MLRKDANLTLDELAKITDIPRSTISAYERGSRPLSHDALMKLTEFFGVEKRSITTPTLHEQSIINPRSEFSSDRQIKWSNASTSQLELLIKNAVEEKDWGSVKKISDELFSRKLMEKLK